MSGENTRAAVSVATAMALGEKPNLEGDAMELGELLGKAANRAKHGGLLNIGKDNIASLYHSVDTQPLLLRQRSKPRTLKS